MKLSTSYRPFRSTALVQAGPGGNPDLINSPSGSFSEVERLDGNNLGVFASALPRPCSLLSPRPG